MKIILGNKNYSSWSLRPWLLMQHFGLDFSEQHISLFADDMHQQMQLHCPNYKVPVLVDAGISIWDSLAICEYINEQYLADKGWPQNPLQRATARSMCSEMHSGFFALREEMPMNCRREAASITLSSAAQADIDRIVELISQCLAANAEEDGFLFSEFSIADAFYMPIVSRLHSYNIETPQPVASYLQKMLSLPAFQLWLSAAKAETQVIEVAEV
ncbi:MAG: hypothetical protein OFPI_24370 [Osedax symbiont Rs2]|nr:MAG: hypothetical protein OFPI_24370 [Osedax symbiont Rs2]